MLIQVAPERRTTVHKVRARGAIMPIQAAPEGRTKVHEVTLAQVFWTEPERGVPGLALVPLHPVWARVRTVRDRRR